MRQWIRRLGIAIGLLIGLGVLMWQWPYLRLPGTIALLLRTDVDDGPSQAIYLFRPGRILTQRWTRITPSDVYVDVPTWAPNLQSVAFRCSDGITDLKSTHYLVFRPGKKQPEEYPLYETPPIKEGLCVVDWNGKNFRWLMEATTATDVPRWISWTLDGQYVVFHSTGHQYRVEPQTGAITSWHGEKESADLMGMYGYVDLCQFLAVETWQILDFSPCLPHQIRNSGFLSPGGRYLLFSISGGENDPTQAYIYDTKTRHLSRWMRGKNFGILAWLPVH